MSPVERLKELVGRATPGSWISIETGFGETNYLVCHDVPGRLHPVCALEQQSPDSEANAELICAAVNIAKALASDDAVERLARAMWNASNWHPDMPSFAHEHTWDDAWPDAYCDLRGLIRTQAQAALSALLPDVLGEE